jgi:hypothetical protein
MRVETPAYARAGGENSKTNASESKPASVARERLRT